MLSEYLVKARRKCIKVYNFPSSTIFKSDLHQNVHILFWQICHVGRFMKTSTTCCAKTCYTIESNSLRFRYVLTLGGTGRASIFSRGCVGGDAWAVGGKSNAWRVTSRQICCSCLGFSRKRRIQSLISVYLSSSCFSDNCKKSVTFPWQPPAVKHEEKN